MNNRFLIDFANPDAGIGHSMGFINRALKIAARNNLTFAYSESQLVKSSDTSWRWQLKQTLRNLRGKKRYETHNLGNNLNLMLGIEQLLPSRDAIVSRIKQGELKLIELPFPDFPIPSNHQQDDQAYQAIDLFIESHPEPNTVFKLNNALSADYEYASTKDWFINAYEQARTINPIPLIFDPKKLNIAVHIRRGDLLPGRQFSDLSSRMLPDAWYLTILKAIPQTSQKQIAIHLFSEGKEGVYHSETGAPFSWKQHFENTPYEIYEHIDSDFLVAFHHLMHADILIGSKSGMSHLAGTLGQSIKLMPSMWHSYRAVDKLLELPDVLQDINKQTIAAHIEQHAALVN